MTLTIVASDIGGGGTQVHLGDDENLFVSAGVTIVSTDDLAVNGTGDNETANVQGTIVGFDGAVDLGTSGADFGQTLIVGDEGLLRSLGSASVAASLRGSGSVLDNRGTIRSAGHGVELFGDDPAATSVVRNSGLILAESGDGVRRATDAYDTIELYNSGEIRAKGIGDHVYDGGQQSHAARDVIVNAGLMVGNIRLADGDNSYDGSAGRVIGEVVGGSGVDVLTGGAFADAFFGLDGEDILSGGGGDDLLVAGGANDRIYGGTGSDVLYGGFGADSMFGGAGNDEFYGEDGGDTMDGGAGNDTFQVEGAGNKVIDNGGGLDLVFASVTFNLSNPAQAVGAIETLRLGGIADINGTGNALANTIQGNIGINFIHGMAGNDAVVGDDGNDRLWGDAGNDSVSGGDGTDLLYGGFGNDKLTGGALADKFVFDTKPHNALNRDLITDFQHGVDKIVLSHGVFAGIGGGGGLNPAFFFQDAAAHDASDRVIYNKATGVLSYDNDGIGAHAAIQFAVLSNKPVVTASDFAVI